MIYSVIYNGENIGKIKLKNVQISTNECFLFKNKFYFIDFISHTKTKKEITVLDINQFIEELKQCTLIKILGNEEDYRTLKYCEDLQKKLEINKK